MRQIWNLPNQLTLFRLLGIPLILICILYGEHRWALLLFIAAAITDAIDGLAARRLNQRTQLGAYLDPIADKLLLSSSFFVLALVQSIPWWVTILVLSRDVIIVATTLVVALATHIRDFAPSTLGKLNTAVQVATVLAVVVRNAYPGPSLERLSTGLIWLTGAFTVLSGVHYAFVMTRRLARHATPLPPGEAPPAGGGRAD
jgi:cardiolipin synthase